MTAAAILSDLFGLMADKTAPGRLARLLELEARASAAERSVEEERAAFGRLQEASRNQLARLAESVGRWRDTAAGEEGQSGEEWLIAAEQEWQGIGLPVDAPNLVELAEYLSRSLVN